MHEWALAEAVITTVEEIVEREKYEEVFEVSLTIGELQQIDTGIMKFALKHLKEGKLKKAKFSIKMHKASFKCNVCGNLWVFNKNKFNEEVSEAIHFIPEVSHTYIKCPKCKSPDFNIVEGRGLYIQKIRGRK
ncbi:MAG: hydrogenase nickel incorporation protein HypA [Nitrososphaeria archaeon]